MRLVVIRLLVVGLAAGIVLGLGTVGTAAPKGPDLAALILTAPAAAQVGESVTVRYEVRNVGGKPAPKSEVIFWLNLPAGTVRLARAIVPRLGPGETVTGWLTGAVPPAPTGTYPLGVTVNPAQSFAEASFANNVASRPLAVTSPIAQAHVSWDTNNDGVTVGYRLFFGSSPRTYTTVIDVGPLTSWTVTNLTPGATYYFAVKAYDPQGNEGPVSAEVAKTF